MSLGTETVRPQTGPAETPSATSDEAVWRARPLAAQAIRALVLVVPAIVSVGAVVALHRAMPPERSWEGFAIIVAIDVVVILFVASVVHRILQRLLPLATLLSLSLVFPDRSPRRFKIVLRANSSARMRTRLLEARNEDTDVSTALEDLLTYLAALARHDRMTRGHCERVRAFVDLLAVEMDLSKADQDRLRWAALLHDIGKLRVPAKILRKPGKPTDDEWETLKRHPVDGEKLVRPLAPWLGAWTMAVEQHHERFGGGGYPRGLVGTEISLGGRIVAVADAYEVMITSRPYKRPVKPECARQEFGPLLGGPVRSSGRTCLSRYFHRESSQSHGLHRPSRGSADPGHRTPGGSLASGGGAPHARRGGHGRRHRCDRRRHRAFAGVQPGSKPSSPPRGCARCSENDDIRWSTGTYRIVTLISELHPCPKW